MANAKQLVKYTTFKHFMNSDYEITSKINVIHNSDIDRSRKDIPTILSARTSMKRAHKKLFEVLRSNTWDYFVTLTFDNIDYYILSALSVKPLNFTSILHYVKFEMLNPSYLTDDYFRERLGFLKKCKYIYKSGTEYYVTDLGKVNTKDKLDDTACRKKFSKWAKDMRALLPNMYYVAVPEYHKKGGLHYHVVVGGVTADDLDLVDSGRVYHCGSAWNKDDYDANGFVYDEKTGDGALIYNVNVWRNVGFSTATKVRYTDAVAKYVGKYLSKADIDPRFYNKRRFHCSCNIHRPTLHRYECDLAHQQLDDCNRFDLEEEGLAPVYEDEDRGFISYGLAELDQENVLYNRCRGIVPDEHKGLHRSMRSNVK